MAQIIALVNQKGGVAKTSSTINLGAALVELGKRVLLVDIDPQASLTAALGINPAKLSVTIYNVLVQRTPIADALLTVHGMRLLPSTIDLASAEVQLMYELSRERILGDALAPLLPDFDLVLIDCPPSLGQLTINALTCADWVLIPMGCRFLALRGLEQLSDTIAKIQVRANHRLRILGILPTMFDARTSHEQEVLDTVRKNFPNGVFDPIRKSIRFPESSLEGMPLLLFDPHHAGSEAYRVLAKEVLHGIEA